MKRFGYLPFRLTPSSSSGGKRMSKAIFPRGRVANQELDGRAQLGRRRRRMVRRPELGRFQVESSPAQRNRDEFD